MRARASRVGSCGDRVGEHRPDTSSRAAGQRDRRSLARAGASADIDVEDDVVIVGSGLTAVDVLLRTRRARTSRSNDCGLAAGRWPAAHDNPTPPCVVATPPTTDVAGLGPHPTARSLVHAVRRQLALHPNEDRNHSSISSARTPSRCGASSMTPSGRLPDSSCPLTVEQHRHRMAPAIADRLTSILWDSRVSTVAGRIGTIEAGQGTCTVTIDRAGSSVEVDTRWVAIARGLYRTSSPGRPVGSFDARPWAGTSRLRGRGLDVDDCGRVAAAGRDRLASAITAIGPMRLGAEYETTAIPEIRDQAASLSLRLIDQLDRAQVA